MKITLLQIDKTDVPWVSEGFEVYEKRLKHYIPFTVQTIVFPKANRNKSFEQQKKEEAVLLLKELEKFDYIILLDEKGKTYSSKKFSEQLNKLSISGKKHIVFVIGGPYGFDESIYTKANDKLSLSEMTFSHQMIRVFFAEQLYRAFSILKGEKYHHE
ncbi:MAG: 23S rRNA (pseudouridine(1915)-N(3))-methyltransferase RlmH [Bacteroidota bacterium]|nr:23S rRNA (pseudouridine(1915)-N(3))-methyltransferase RlmH [Bacteroidota bacterium]